MDLKKLQQKIEFFCIKNNLHAPAEHRLLDTISELGEVSKEILKSSNYGSKKASYTDGLKEELGDALYSLITVANSFQIDLEEALNEALNKYKKRAGKGSIGSENAENPIHT
jgi:NTP pyrophosphatase (non-canonical NTP hydrolase)